MAILRLKSMSVSVDDEAASLSASNLWVRQFTIQNIAGSDSAYIGDENVADTDGFPMAAGSSLAFDPNRAANSSVQQINLAEIYAVCASGETATLRVLYLVEESE